MKLKIKKKTVKTDITLPPGRIVCKICGRKYEFERISTKCDKPKCGGKIICIKDI